MPCPREIVDRQHAAYNARDIDSYCALFSSDAVILRLNDGAELARGLEAIRLRYSERFKSPNLDCQIKSRVELGDFVVDHEQVTGITDGVLQVIAIYEVRQSLICGIRIIWP